MKVSIIAAVSKNGIIGKNNDIPWKGQCPNDFKWFKEKTLGKPIIMGRKTYESIGRPLLKRINIVITRQPDYCAPGCEIVHSLEEALEVSLNSGAVEAMVIGGFLVYQEALQYADQVYLTHIDKKFDGDVAFPELNNEWKAVESVPGVEDEKNIKHCFVIYEKV